VRLGIMTLQRCQFVALDERWSNPSIRMLSAMKLMDIIVILWLNRLATISIRGRRGHSGQQNADL
jgi:hypothetical protein